MSDSSSLSESSFLEPKSLPSQLEQNLAHFGYSSSFPTYFGAANGRQMPESDETDSTFEQNQNVLNSLQHLLEDDSGIPNHEGNSHEVILVERTVDEIESSLFGGGQRSQSEPKWISVASKGKEKKSGQKEASSPQLAATPAPVTMSSGRAPCKFYLGGGCKAGSLCKFAHDVHLLQGAPLRQSGAYIPPPSQPPAAAAPSSSSHPPSSLGTIPIQCKYFALGWCKNGPKCPFLHGKPERQKPVAPAAPKEVHIQLPSTYDGKSFAQATTIYGALDQTTVNKEKVGQAMRPVCPFYLQGDCRYGDRCIYAHAGEPCPHCGKPVINLEDPISAEKHMKECQERQELALDREDSKHHECGVCFENIVDKRRRFGVLMGCDHKFCLECIRTWRDGRTSSAAVDAVRSCPICRNTSHYIIPSVSYPRTPERKEELVHAYKTKLSAIPCRHFDYGDGSCPFGTSCFYAHLNPDGSAAPTPQIRKAANSEGEVLILKQVNLCDFIFRE